ncbi:LCP family protein [Fusibacter sp. JL216-2]|uniref:LCP family protein n=1 Tax=Fusibacter sp. JL216-2 TaxID=3071453 RepID=UPI003D355874
MKYYLKIFLISFLCFAAMFGSAIYAFTQFAPEPEAAVPDKSTETIEIGIDRPEEEEVVDNRTELQKLVDASGRINVLVFGTDGARADTIMLASYDPDAQQVDVLSVPRDTYHYVPGHERSDQKKINAVYGLGNDDGGSLGMKQEIANLLGIPVHYYVKVSYNGVADIIDLIGGVKINVPFNMNYDDEYADPPLHIHINKGSQVLDGTNSMKYLRWRQNNDGSNQTGDIGRIKRQQDFVIAAAKKAISPRLPVVIKTAFSYVYTDMGINDAIYYANNLVEFNTNNIDTYRLPGEWTGFYYVHDPAETETILEEIYSKGQEKSEDTQ